MTVQVVRSTDRVPFREKIALGAGSFTALFGYVGVSMLAFPVYNMILGVNTALLGMALMIPRLWDAFTDPVMGQISDNYHSKWGRRRPFIICGAVLMGIIYGLIWIVPSEWNEVSKITYFIIAQILFFSCYTVFSVPYNALTYEMTPDYNERTRVMAYTAFFHKAGEFLYQWTIPIAAIFSLHLFASKDVNLPGIRIVAWLIGLVIMSGIGVLPGVFVKERFQKKTEHQQKVRLIESISQAFSNKAFLILVTIIVLNTLSGVLAMGIDHYILIYYMGDGDITLGSVWKALLSSGYAVVGFAAIPVIAWLAKLFSKKGALYFVYSLMVFGGIMKWFIFQPGHHIYNINLGFTILKFDPIILIDPLLCGPMWVAVKIMLASMMADICDDDELRHKKRREGMFGAVFSWIEKSAVSLSYFGTGLALSLSGFNNELGGNQAPETFTTMRLFLAGAPAITAVFALVALKFYPITAERAAQTRKELEERRGVVGTDI
ncbi:MAG: MFS transporter [Sedimentisphaerales bacterium]|nr:MFS transporter [Sedimentisphaerales bacterium]